MNTRNIIFNLFYFLMFFLLQILLFQNISLSSYAFCFIYVGFLLTLPIEMSKLLLMVIGMATGLMIDIFYNTLGIHTAACVLIAYMKPHIINILTPRGGYDAGAQLSISSLGFQWVFTYAAILIFIHHLALFFLESWGFNAFFFTFLKALCSTLFTLSVFILFQYLIYSPRKSK
jgi:hypothetical protein